MKGKTKVAFWSKTDEPLRSKIRLFENLYKRNDLSLLVIDRNLQKKIKEHIKNQAASLIVLNQFSRCIFF